MIFSKKNILIAVIVCTAASLWAQGTQPSLWDGVPEWTEDNPNPKPYSLEEFPKWAVGIRRFEIVTLGSFPIMLFYTRIVSDIVRFSINKGDMRYAPWPFRGAGSYQLTTNEHLQTFAIAAGLSLLIGTIDAIIVWRRAAK